MSQNKETKARTDGPARDGDAPPTLKTIAGLSGLAVATVSRALGDAPDISAETKKKVRRIAADIGYVPNRAGVRLRTGRTNVVSLVLSTEHDMMNHTARLISSIAGGLRDTPFHMIVTPYFPSDDPMKPIRYIVETGSADAVIFNQILPRDPRVRYLMDAGFPFATHGRSDWAPKHAYFDYDNAAFARIGVEQLVARGRRRILLIAPPQHQNYGQDMVAGASAAAQAAGVSLQIAERITSDSASADLMVEVARLAGDGSSFDGMICGSTNSTMASIAGIESRGLTVGRDIDVFTKESMPFLKFFRKPILVVREDVKSAGEFLARAAIQAARHPELPPLQHLDQPVWGDHSDFE